MPDSIESRMARVEAEMSAAQRAVDIFGPTAGQVIELEVEMRNARRELDDFRGWLGDVETRVSEQISGVAKSVENLRADFRKYDEARADARTRIALAVIAGSFTVLAAIVAATAAIMTAG